MAESASGLLVLNKPTGLTSFDCVHRARRSLGEKRVGHCGTLDPLARGVLVLLFGQATRLQERFLEMDKQYWLQGEFGRQSETGDQEGAQVECAPFEGVENERLAALLKSFEGERSQVPPQFAALKYRGKPYYRWAREGIAIPRAPRLIRIYSFELLRLEGATWEARVVCSRGTYVRTLVEEVASSLGTGGLLTSLIRERVGPYDLSDALSLEQVVTMPRQELLDHCEKDIRHHPRHL